METENTDTQLSPRVQTGEETKQRKQRKKTKKVKKGNVESITKEQEDINLDDKQQESAD